MSGFPPAIDRKHRIATTRLVVIRSHLRVPMFRDGYALVLSNGIAAVLGLIFWSVAARRYDPAVLGMNAAVISTMQLLGGVAQLNLASAMVRFVPTSGRLTRRFVAVVYLVSLACGLVVSVVFLAGVDIWTPALHFLRDTPILGLAFIVSTMAWAVFNLQHFALTSLRGAVLVPLENGVYSVGKLGLLVILATVLPVWGIYTSWTAALALTVLPTTVLIFGWLAPRHEKRAALASALPGWTQIVRYSAADYVGGLCWLASTNLVPIIVLQQGGAAANAYFSLGWVLVMPLYLVSISMGYSLVVSSVSEEGTLKRNTYRMLIQTSLIVVALAAALFVAAPYVLHIFGSEYSTQGTPVLRLLALSTIPGMINTLYVNVARVRRTMGVVVAILGAQSILVIGLSWLFFRLFGLTGVGIAWVAGQSLVALVVAIRAAGEFRSAPPGAEPGEADDRRGAPPISVRGLRTLRGVAERLGVLETLESCRAGLRRRQRLREVTPYVAEVLGRAPDPDETGLHAWTVRRLFRSVTDMAVVGVGPASLKPVAALKLPLTAIGSASLDRELQALTAINDDPRLKEWRRFLPAVLDYGRVSGRPYLLEELLPGVDARRLVRNPAARMRVLLAAADAISGLHRRTASPTVIDDVSIGRWVQEPISLLRDLCGELGGTARWSRTLDRLSAQMRESLLERTATLAWIHGDLCFANILVTPDGGSLTGFVDWELADGHGLPALDFLHLLLSTRALVQRRQIGAVALELLERPAWTEVERTLLSAIPLEGPLDGPDLRTLVVLCWLRHVASNLAKSGAYARNRLWIESNVIDVLERLS